jgi:hypothetical protein
MIACTEVRRGGATPRLREKKMSWWSIAVYSVAALVGLRTLFALMAQHRRRHLNQLIEAETARQEAETGPIEETSAKSLQEHRAAA